MIFRSPYCLLGLLAMLLGCRSDTNVEQQESPRPVSVFTLPESNPSLADRVTGSIVSWKTEEIGFEVAGRVAFVIEPETDVIGSMYDAQGNPLTGGTTLAKIDETRYQLNVESAQAEVETSQRHRDAIAIQIDRVVPAQVRAADAERDLAQTELDRTAQLFSKNAATKSDLDRWTAKLEASVATVEGLKATLEEKRADLAATDAKTKQLQQALAEAKRDVADCTLVAPYAAQVAAVHAVPGAYVERGEPVATVQMMDPIKVDFEVSADLARRLRHGDRLTVEVAEIDGSQGERRGFIYMIDPNADADTRTFTVTLMLRNSKAEMDVPTELQGQSIARTSATWRLLRGIGGTDDSIFFTEAGAIHDDDVGAYVWKILNRTAATTGSTTPVLQVEKVRVRRGELELPLLGLFTFRQVTIVEEQDFDPASDLIAGELTLPSGVSEPWMGDNILVDRPRWRLRPGDLVSVDLGGESKPGLYVPLNAIKNDLGRKVIFVVAPGKAGEVAHQVEVNTSESVGRLIRIEATGDQPLQLGVQVVVGQAHYLVDGEQVVVVEEVEVQP